VNIRGEGPLLLLQQVCNLPSPSAIVEAVHGTRLGTRGAIHGRRTAGGHLVAHVGRNVGPSGRLLGRSRVEGQVAHATAELVRHVVGKVIGE
jgi:hypothetical protein